MLGKAVSLLFVLLICLGLFASPHVVIGMLCSVTVAFPERHVCLPYIEIFFYICPACQKLTDFCKSMVFVS